MRFELPRTSGDHPVIKKCYSGHTDKAILQKHAPRRSPLAGVDVNAAGVPGLDREGIGGDDGDVVAFEADGGVHQLSATDQPDAVGGVGLNDDLLVGAACSGGWVGSRECYLLCGLQWWEAGSIVQQGWHATDEPEAGGVGLHDDLLSGSSCSGGLVSRRKCCA